MTLRSAIKSGQTFSQEDVMKLEGNDRLLTVFEVGAMLSRKPSTVRKDLFLKRYPSVKIGRQIRVPLSAVEAMVKAGYRPAADAAR